MPFDVITLTYSKINRFYIILTVSLLMKFTYTLFDIDIFVVIAYNFGQSLVLFHLFHHNIHPNISHY